MTNDQYLLTCLMEECAEVQQCAAKAIRFGYFDFDDAHPENKDNNWQMLQKEMTDLVAIMELVVSSGSAPFTSFEKDKIESKKQKFNKWIEYSKEKGFVEKK